MQVLSLGFKSYFVFIGIVFCSSAHAAHLTIKNSNKDTINNYYADLSDKLLIKFGVDIKFLSSKIKSAQQLSLYPSNVLNIGGTVNYKWLGIGVFLGLPPTQTTLNKKGRTTRTDLRLNIYNKFFAIDAFYQKYKGYYIANSNEVLKSNSNSLVQLGNMSQYAVGSSVAYILNYKKFSYKSAYVRNTVQKQDAGSFLLGILYNFDGLLNNTGFTDNKNILNTVKLALPIQSYQSSFEGITAGVTTNLTGKHFFANLFGQGGLGINTTHLTVFEIKNNKVTSKRISHSITKLTYQIIAKVVIGYEKNNYIFNFIYANHTRQSTIQGYKITSLTGSFKLLVAKRFK